MQIKLNNEESRVPFESDSLMVFSKWGGLLCGLPSYIEGAIAVRCGRVGTSAPFVATDGPLRKHTQAVPSGPAVVYGPLSLIANLPICPGELSISSGEQRKRCMRDQFQSNFTDNFEFLDV